MITGFENTIDQLDALAVRSDLISRQEAIVAIKRAEAMVRAFGYQAVVDAVKAVPPEPEQKKGKWIPCQERLPEKDGNYLIWFQYKNALGKLHESMAMEYYADSTGWDCDNVEVIAWHTLPAPYKAQKGYEIY